VKAALLLLAAAVAAPGQTASLKASIEKHLGRPYVWGATGLKSFDCSGFVWRVLDDSGLFMKRTTARKLYFSLPPAAAQHRWTLGNLVFFDDLKHVGIVNDDRSFYHAESRIGTNLSRFDPYWRRKVFGVRALPRLKMGGH